LSRSSFLCDMIFHSWFLYLLGMLGVGSINIYIPWNVPCQSSCEFGSPGYFFRQLIFDTLVCSITFYRIHSFSSKTWKEYLLILLQLALSILLAGILCVYINYDCDRQRQEFRRTNGKCSVWGKAPTKVLVLNSKIAKSPSCL
jgi:hypothetical protein